MGTVTGLTAEAMQAIVAATIVDGNVVGDNLILISNDNTEHNVGSVRGPVGPAGANGSGYIVCTSQSRPNMQVSDEGKVIYETDTDLVRVWTGSRWKCQEQVVCTSTTRPVGLAPADEGVTIYETDSDLSFIWTGTGWRGMPVVPLGSCIDYYGPTEPIGDVWRFPNGQTLDRTTFAALFALIGTTYGAGNGTTTFNLPDATDRVSLMKAQSTTLGGKGGQKTVALTTAQMPVHNHTTDPAGNHTHNPSGYQFVVGELATSSIWMNTGPVGSHAADVTYTAATDAAGNHNHTINNAGSGSAHENMPPYIICNQLMRVS